MTIIATPPQEERTPVDAERVRQARIRTNRIFGWVAILVPTIAFGIGLALFPPPLYCLGLAVLFWALTGVGISVGFHRHFTHRAFKAIAPVRVLLAGLGSMALQGPVTYWVPLHRRHHAHSDEEGDPHSPRAYSGAGLWQRFLAFLHGHVLWVIRIDRLEIKRYAPDILDDKVAMTSTRLYWMWASLGLLLPAGMAYAIGGTPYAFWMGFLYGGLVRVFLVQHITWSINSLCHVAGERPFQTGDDSGNIRWLAFLSIGESWHNNHHAFPSSFTFSVQKRQFDWGARVVSALEKFGLAWDLKHPNVEARRRRLAGS